MASSSKAPTPMPMVQTAIKPAVTTKPKTAKNQAECRRIRSAGLGSGGLGVSVLPNVRTQSAKCAAKSVLPVPGWPVSKSGWESSRAPLSARILRQARERDYGLRTLVHAGARSELFLRK